MWLRGEGEPGGDRDLVEVKLFFDVTSTVCGRLEQRGCSETAAATGGCRGRCKVGQLEILRLCAHRSSSLSIFPPSIYSPLLF